jgi:hypothetical protein
MFKKLRIMILLYILILVAAGTWFTQLRTTDWNEPLWMVIHPIAGDNTRSTRKFIDGLERDDFSSIEQFMAREAQRFGVQLKKPVAVKLGAELAELPPAPPRGGNVLQIMWWSLNMRYWSWQIGGEHPTPTADIRMYVIFHNPDTAPVGHNSFGLQKGMIGVVHGFASRRMKRKNAVIVAHEMLHTVGATDKYDPFTNLPLHPDGYAEPNRNPLHPQRKAEIMGGRIPVSDASATIPSSLKKAVVGPLTASEIRWTE